ncbi:polyphenol oxidase family protein [Sulfurihydrogenibium subterraneum]|uniref:polyphenol oxidase family protein n=1 Tax=Sulfurihydrogenibium subterraneum TaxID=171121 RepID=UPI000686D443|nr:polyphenol oxidase family protein [Sulfurihydrogenibium subterraneum]
MRFYTFDNILIAFTEKQDLNQREEKNRLPLKNHLNVDTIHIPNQKHSNKVVKIEEDLTQECDGIYTDKKNTAIGVLTADCIPIVLFNSKELAVIHAGWRGLFDGIIENGFSLFKDKNVKAFIGACIRGCCYEVDKQFVNDLNISDKFYKIYNDKPYLDLVAVAISILKKLSVKDIYDIGECTKCSGKFFSYRNGDFESRILTAAVIKE